MAIFRPLKPEAKKSRERKRQLREADLVEVAPSDPTAGLEALDVIKGKSPPPQMPSRRERQQQRAVALDAVPDITFDEQVGTRWWWGSI